MQQIITKTSEGQGTELAVLNPPQEFEVVYQTSPPGGPHGFHGPDVSTRQSVAVRFEPAAGRYLKRIGLWFMNNGAPNVPEVIVTLRNDKSEAGASTPGEQILDRMRFRVSAIGWTPVLERVDSNTTPYLEAGTKYWLVAESEAPPHENGVWVNAGRSTGFSSTTFEGSWQPGGEGAVPATIVWGIPPVD